MSSIKEKYLYFLEHCTRLSQSSLRNYTDFGRINTTIGRLCNQPSLEIYDVVDLSEFDELVSRIKSDDEFIAYNKRGNNQYSNSLTHYRYFLEALQLSQGYVASTQKGLSQTDSLVHQAIFFGTPGSGKSHRVKALTEGKKVHRTTFHPDSDYASFVGCYKPCMQEPPKYATLLYSFDELALRTKEFEGKSYGISKFFAKYSESMKRLSGEEKKKLSEDLSSPQRQDPSMERNIGIALGAFMREDLEELEKPTREISYSFVPQVFTEAYIDAWTHPTKEVYLVIEEINRGNCAQIFGDLFQLLDRNAEGYSDYRIKADQDLKGYLKEQLGTESEGIKHGELCLPPNLHILATMNTSDQSLFPMDSAFKRRWDWVYVPVDYSESVPSSLFVITLGDKTYRWVEFLKIVNERIRKATDSEDKQLGNFFIRGALGEDEFKSKVMFYLWNEVCRDEYGTPRNFFRSKENGEEVEFSFNDLYQADGLDKLHGFMAYLGVDYRTEEQASKDPEQEE